MRQFTFYYDPSHGWLEVPAADLRLTGLKPHDFSFCSYFDGNNYYFEEDCDAPKFLHAWKEKFGHPSIHEHELRTGNNFIRRLPRNTGQAA